MINIIIWTMVTPSVSFVGDGIGTHADAKLYNRTFE